MLPANLTAVTLTASPTAPRATGTPVTHHRDSGGGITAGNVQYQFFAQYKLANGAWSSNILIQDWSTSSSCVWTPTTAEQYYVNVYARPVGDTAPYAVTSYLIYNILPANMTGVTLTASPISPQKGHGDTLTATPQGGITAPNVQYSVRRAIQAGDRCLGAEYSSSATGAPATSAPGPRRSPSSTT